MIGNASSGGLHTTFGSLLPVSSLIDDSQLRTPSKCSAHLFKIAFCQSEDWLHLHYGVGWLLSSGDHILSKVHQRTSSKAFCLQHTGFQPASVAQLDAPSDWRSGSRGFKPRRGRQHSFVEIDHEIFSTVILSLPLIQEGQLSVSGERMCTILVNRLED